MTNTFTKESLTQLVNNATPQDNSNDIRNKKHSSLIRNDIIKLIDIKRNNTDKSAEEIDKLCCNSCFFLFKNYTNIYNLFVKKNLNFSIMDKLLSQLEKIENGSYNQHQASVKVGELLKEIYVDSVMAERKENEEKEKLDEDNKVKKEKAAIKNISWKQFKNNNM